MNPAGMSQMASPMMNPATITTRREKRAMRASLSHSMQLVGAPPAVFSPGALVGTEKLNHH
jgi:hypothetical protein